MPTRTTNKKPAPKKKALQIPAMGDKELLNDCLNSEKNCTAVYNTFANECVNQNIRSDFMNTLKDAHDIQSELFTEAQNRGWYAVKDARTTDIKQAAQKYATASS